MVYIHEPQTLSSKINSVAFPALSIIQDQKSKVRSVIIKICSAYTLVVIPLMTLLFVQAENFIQYFLGIQWVDAVPIIKIFCLTAIVQNVYTPGLIWQSLNKVEVQFRIGLVSKGLLFVFMFFGLQLGELKGLALAILLSSLLSFYPLFYFSARIIDFSFRSFLSILFTPLIVSFLLAILLEFQRFLLPIDSFFLMFLECAIFLLLYLIALLVYKPRALVELKEFMPSKIAKLINR